MDEEYCFYIADDGADDEADVVSTIPTDASLPDLAIEPASVTESGWFTSAMYIDECALCEIGCCIQRVSNSIDGGWVLHGVLGEA